MKKISGILLDFDGVLSSITVRLGWPFYHALKKVKPKITKSEILNSLNNIMKMYLKEQKRGLFYVPKVILNITRTLDLNFLQMIRFMILLGVLVRKNNNNIQPEENADEVLGILTKKYKTAIITHAEREVMDHAQTKFKFLKDIDIIITQQDLKYTKPHPEGLTKAIQQLGLNPDETIYVGDLPHDIQAGKRAGTKTVAVVNFDEAKEGKREILEQYKPDYIINHVKDLPVLIEAIECSL